MPSSPGQYIHIFFPFDSKDFHSIFYMHSYKKAIHPYVATQPDELSLEVADVVNVLRKMADGNISQIFLENNRFVYDH